MLRRLSFGLLLGLSACAVATAPDDDPIDAAADVAKTLDASKPLDAGSTPDANVQDANIPDVAIVDAGPDVVLVKDAGPVDSGTLCPTPKTGVLATFDLSLEAGNQAQTAVTTAAPGLTVGALTRGGALTAVSGSGSINSSNWSTGSTLDTTRYYTVKLTPDPKCALSLSSVAIDTKASGTGPTGGAIATSRDAFASTTSFATGSATTVKVVVTKASGALELRVYGTGATGAGGTMRIENTFSISGALE